MGKDIKTYQEQTYIDNTLRLRDVLNTMPPFVKDYFRAIEPTTSARTRISYAYDIRVFFRFLIANNPVYKDYTLDMFELKDLEQIEPVDIEEYQEYLSEQRQTYNKQGTRAFQENVRPSQFLCLLLQKAGDSEESYAFCRYAENTR